MPQALKKIFGTISKVDEADDGTITVYGIASTGARDSVGEIVTPDAMKGALPDYSKYPALREMHQPIAAGRVTEAYVDEDGATQIAALVVDPLAITKVKTQVYAAFSIGGKVLKRDGQDRSIITELKLVEISLVDSPANPDAALTMWKADIMTEFKPASAAVVARAKDLAKAAGLGAAAHRDFLFKAKDELIAEHLLEKGEIEEPSAEAPAPEAEIAPPEAELVADPPEALEPEAEAGEAETIEAAAQPGPDEDDHGGEGGTENDDPDAKAAAAAPEANPLVAALEEAIAKGGEIIDTAAPAAPEAAPGPFADLGKVVAALKGITLKRGEESVAKGLYSVSRFADLLQSFAYLQECAQSEAEYEGDGSPVPAQLADAIRNLGAIFVAMAQEEIAELIADLGDDSDVEIVFIGDEFELAASIVDAVKADADLMAKAAERAGAADEDSTAKAARLAELEGENEKLSKALEAAAPAVEEMTKRFGETIDGLKGQIGELTEKFDALDKTVIPAKTAGPGAARVVNKAADTTGAEAADDGPFAGLTAEQFEKTWAGLSEAERGQILIKAALARPHAVTAR